jgi:predicted house-cleaning noncanonical NTP pyrophosphatase (MazG superfamily)
MKQSHKLVRDKVPALMLASGHRTVTRTIAGTELIAALRAEIGIELLEYDAAATGEAAAGELADLLELIVALAKQRGYSEERLAQIRAEKKSQRGSFDQGLLLVEIE